MTNETTHDEPRTAVGGLVDPIVIWRDQLQETRDEPFKNTLCGA